MDNEEGYSWETIRKIQICMGRLTSELIFCYPSRIERNLAILKTDAERRGLGKVPASKLIIDRLVEEAKSILIASGNPTELKKLKSLKGYDALTGETGNVSLQIISAKQVLISAEKLKKYLDKKRTEEAVIETVRLLAATIACHAEYVAWRGIRSIVAVEKKKPKRELEGIQKAIAMVIELGKGRNPSMLGRYFFKNHQESNPLEVGNFEVFVAKDTSGQDRHEVCQRDNETRKIRRITWKTFLGPNYYQKIKKI